MTESEISKKSNENLNIKYSYLFYQKKKITDLITKITVYGFAVLAVIILLTLVGFIIYKSTYFLSHYSGGFWGFISGNTWNANNNQFGIWLVIVSTFFVLLFSLVISVPLTIFSSLFICEFLSPRVKIKVIKIVQLLAGIPSVVFGLFTLSIMGPFFMLLGAPSSSNMLVTAITLAFMGLPIMISLSVNGIENVPESYRYGSMALGLSKTYTTFHVVLKSAKYKIIPAVMLGVARIIGETMAVLMIAGNSPSGLDLHNGFMNFIFSSITTLASTIGIELLENSGPLHESALYSIGLVLFIVVCFINIVVLTLQYIANRRHNHHRSRKYTIDEKKSKKSLGNYKLDKLLYQHIEKNRTFKKIKDGIGQFFLISSTVIVIFFTLLITFTIIIRGLFEMHWGDLISTSQANGGAGILSAFLVTLLLVVASIIFATPISLFVALYLNEYSNNSNWLVKILRFSLDVLSSTPSIIYGAFGLAFFIGILHMPLSIFTAALTLTIVILPIMIRSIEESLTTVPDGIRHASLALGANKSSTIFKVVLPNAMPGIVTAIILAIGRIIGESAPVYLTLGTAVRLPISGFMSPGASMTTEILMLVKEGTTASAMRIMYELAFVIMVMILMANSLASIIGKKFSPNYVKISFKNKCKIFWSNIKMFFSKETIKKIKEKKSYVFKKIWKWNKNSKNLRKEEDN